MTAHDVTGRARAELERPGMAQEALFWLRDVLGTVAPRDPVNRRLGPRRYRLELLAELLDRDTFVMATSWLASEAVPAVTSKQYYADDLRLWAGVARELGGHERLFIGAITPGIIETWTATQRARGMAPRSVNRRLSVLTAFTEYVKWKTRDQQLASPVTKHDRPKVDPHDETTATPILEVPEFQAVVDAADTAQQALVPVLIYTLAGRVTECCTAGTEHLKTVGGERKLDLRRKGGKGRVFALPPRLCDLVDAAVAGRTGPLLVGDDGQPMSRHAVDRLLNRLGRAAGVLPGRELTPHVLRASKLTHMHDEGIAVEEIQKYADHAHIETTLRYIRMRDNDALKAKHAAAAVVVYDRLVDRFVPSGGAS